MQKHEDNMIKNLDHHNGLPAMSFVRKWHTVTDMDGTLREGIIVQFPDERFLHAFGFQAAAIPWGWRKAHFYLSDDGEEWVYNGDMS